MTQKVAKRPPSLRLPTFQSPTPGPVVFLNGWNGVGKLAIVQSYQMMNGLDKTMHYNHKAPSPSLNSPVATSQPPSPDVDIAAGDPLAGYVSVPSSPTVGGGRGIRTEYFPRIEPRRRPNLHDVILGEEFRDQTIVITDRVPADDEAHIEAIGEYLSISASSGRLFLPICLECQLEENLRRLSSLDRSTRGVSLDPEMGRQIREGRSLFKFEEVKDRIEINVTEMTAIESAVRIKEWVGDRVREQVQAARREERERKQSLAEGAEDRPGTASEENGYSRGRRE